MQATTTAAAEATELAVASWDEWSLLKSVIVGIARHSCFPHEHERMIRSTTSATFFGEFRPGNPFPQEIVHKADLELDNFVRILQEHGVNVIRPNVVDWKQVGGYTGSMVRDGLLVVGSTIIESAYSWRCREHEVDLMLEKTLFTLAQNPRVHVIRAPKPPARETLYDGFPDAMDVNPLNGVRWAINNSRVAFDAADFIRFGSTVVGQLSHVTNQKGIDYVQQNLPAGVSLEILEVNDPASMHLDTGLLPLRQGLCVFNPVRVSRDALAKIKCLRDWKLVPLPFKPKARDNPPSYMTSGWLVMNVLVLSPHKIMVDEYDPEFAEFLRSECEMETIVAPFRHVNSLGGSFHCATIDLVRRS